MRSSPHISFSTMRPSNSFFLLLIFYATSIRVTALGINCRGSFNCGIAPVIGGNLEGIIKNVRKLPANKSFKRR